MELRTTQGDSQDAASFSIGNERLQAASRLVGMALGVNI